MQLGLATPTCTLWQTFTVYSVPVVTHVRPEAAPRWGSFQMTVYLEDDVHSSMLSPVRTPLCLPSALCVQPCALGCTPCGACSGSSSTSCSAWYHLHWQLFCTWPTHCLSPDKLRLQGSLTPEIRLTGANANGTDLVLPARLTADRRALAAATPLEKSPLEAGTHSIHVSLNGQQFLGNMSRAVPAIDTVRFPQEQPALRLGSPCPANGATP